MLTELIVDAGSISYWKLFSLVSGSKGFDKNTKNLFLMQESDSGFINLCKEMELEIVNLIDLFNPDKLTIACDGNKLWRRHFYPEYKGTRAKARAAFPVDWGKFSIVRDEFLMNLSKIYPFKTLYNKYAEADDIIAILTKHLHEEEEIIAVTGDADIHQLFRFSNFRCYNAKDRKEVDNIDWRELINLKVISGDRGDNIKPVARGFGPVKARGVITESEGNLLPYFTKIKLDKQYLLNQRLVNFEFIPKKLEEMILEQYNNVKIIVPDSSEMAMKSNLEYSEILNLFNRKLFKNA